MKPFKVVYGFKINMENLFLNWSLVLARYNFNNLVTGFSMEYFNIIQNNVFHIYIQLFTPSVKARNTKYGMDKD